MSRILFLNYHYIVDRRNSLQKDIYGPSVENFIEQVNYFKKNFPILNPHFFEEIINNDDDALHVGFTFDDGLKEHSTIVKPLLNSLNIKGMFFPCSCIFQDIISIPQSIHYSLALLRINTVYKLIKEGIENNEINHKFEYQNNLGYQQKISKIKQLFKNKLSHSESIILSDYLIQYGLKPFYSNIHNKIHLSKSELIKIKNDGHIIGNHAYNHPYIEGNISIKDLFNEIQRGKVELETILKSKVVDFAYPYGAMNLSNKIKNEIFLKLNIQKAFTTNHGVNDNTVDLYKINRVSVYANDTIETIISKFKI